MFDWVKGIFHKEEKAGLQVEPGILEQVVSVLHESLNVEPGEIGLRSRLVGDLGADDLDLGDILFRLETCFDVSGRPRPASAAVQVGELEGAPFPAPNEELLFPDLIYDERYVQEGRFNAAGLRELAQIMPFADLTEFSLEPSIRRVKELITVGDVCLYVQKQLKATPD